MRGITKHYVEQGDYWPVRMHGRQPIEQRYGVMQLRGYKIPAAGGARPGEKHYTSFHICDLAHQGEVIESWRVLGRPGEDRVQLARQDACVYADALNAEDREYEAAA